MADHNKLFRPFRMLSFNIFCCLLLYCMSVDCAIYSLNNKYSNQRKLHSVEIGSSVAKSANVRLKRDSGTDPSNSNSFSGETNSGINTKRVVLNGTEDSKQAFIHWIGKGTSERIVILTCGFDYTRSRQLKNSQLWISENYGDSFTQKVVAADAKISYIYTFESNPKKLVFPDVTAKKLYTTDDELKTLKVSTVDVEPDLILPHPTDDNKLLLYSLTERKLFVSMDFANTWTLLAENVLPNFFWGVEGFDHSDLVHMEIEGGMSLQAFYKACIAPDCREPTNQTLNIEWPFVENSLIIHQEYMIVQRSNLNGSENYMAVSHRRKEFHRAYFPGDLKTDDFILLNLDDGQIFVAVNHGDHVNLYLSDATGQYFVLSFEDIYSSKQFSMLDVDFHQVKGMNWTFIANKKIGSPSKVVTYISFDKGGNWAPLMVNKTCTKPDDCSLLLHVKDSFVITPVVSMKNVPGLILAHGKVGKSSPSQPSSIFTSNDGGATWIPAPITGMYRLNILDQGSIVTAIPDGLLSGNKNKTVFYSCDAGISWKSHPFDKNGLSVKGVLTEPGTFTTVESVFGHESIFSPWTLVKLNFSVYTKKCDDKTDYEEWYPQDYNVANPAGKCLLGRVVSYTRRKPKANCYIREKERITRDNTIVCGCTEDDYECDFGYEETGNDYECKKAKWFDESFIPNECDNGASTYLKSKGYRKVPADTCQENDATLKEKYDPVKTKCMSAAPTHLTVISEVKDVPTGKVVTFHLIQAGGSKWDTTYKWKFGSRNQTKGILGFKKAKLQTHTFQEPGHYNITVEAENSKGKDSAYVEVHVQDTIRNFHVMKPYGGKTGMPVTITLLVLSDTGIVETNSDHVHFAWTFGEETKLPLLTWNNSMSHVYEKAGTYKVTVEAVNSFSSAYKEFSINIFDDAEILELSFDSKANGFNMTLPYMQEWFNERLQQQLAEDVGVNLNRLESVVIATHPLKALLYIFPSSKSSEANVTHIENIVMDEVKKGNIGVSFGYIPGDVIKITGAKKYSGDKKTSPNMKAVYIAVPVLILAVIVSVVSFIYCRRKLSNIRQYNILHAQDDSDTLLDDDEAPLDLNVDFGARESFRDDAMLDSGGSQLVMVTGGGGSSDNAENC